MARPTYSVLFYIKKHKINKYGEVPIYARITINGQRAELAIKRLVSPEMWNPSRGKLTGNTESVRNLNEYIEQVRSKLISHYNDLVIHNKPISSRAVKELFQNIDRDRRTIMTAFEHNNEQMTKEIGHGLAYGSVKNYYTTIKYIPEFLKHQYRVTDMLLAELNFQWIVNFELYLKTEKNNSQNAAMKHIQRLKRVINVALQNEWLERDPFIKYKCKFKMVHREFLTIEEMKILGNHEFKSKTHELVRDLFIFSCYTGLAYVDVEKLGPEDIITGQNGKKWISTYRGKTDTKSAVPLLPKAQEILDKYKDYPSLKEGRVLPVMTNQKINVYLKEAAGIAEIKKSLTFHLARHTFATTVTLTNGVPIETVSKMLGHNSLRTTQIYAKVIEKKVGEDMDILEKKLAQRQKERDNL